MSLMALFGFFSNFLITYGCVLQW